MFFHFRLFFLSPFKPHIYFVLTTLLLLCLHHHRCHQRKEDIYLENRCVTWCIAKTIMTYVTTQFKNTTVRECAADNNEYRDVCTEKGLRLTNGKRIYVR